MGWLFYLLKASINHHHWKETVNIVSRFFHPFDELGGQTPIDAARFSEIHDVEFTTRA